MLSKASLVVSRHLCTCVYSLQLQFQPWLSCEEGTKSPFRSELPTIKGHQLPEILYDDIGKVLQPQPICDITLFLKEGAPMV